MKSAMETGNMTRNGLMEHCTLVWIWIIWDASLASLFVCRKKSLLLLLCVCLVWLLLLGFWFFSFFFSFLFWRRLLWLLFVERLHTRSVLALLVFFASGFLWFFVFLS
ncbi:hypothetical protein J3F84DRAFT_2120 [Trichoderma pleuroticola]